MPDRPDEIVFKRDLYQGVARDYDRFRVPYSETMLQELMARVKPSPAGRLLDLACGTGQVAFSLADRFADVWAVDQEEDMVEVVRQKAAGRCNSHVRAFVAIAETFDAPDHWFELVTIGNAFHRLRREAIAAQAMQWLLPGGYLALLWSSLPWDGSLEWQRAMSAVLDAWKAMTDVSDRLPPGWDTVRLHRPDGAILADAGFDQIDRLSFPVEHDWTMENLIGFVHSTSTLPRKLLGDDAPALEVDLRRELDPYLRTGGVKGTISFAAELARRPV
jgi:SAM-dependent methyltransferase